MFKLRKFVLKWLDSFEKDFNRFVQNLPESVQFFLALSMLFHLVFIHSWSLIETARTDFALIGFLLVLFQVEKKVKK